jgi:hypothetical protein
VAIVLYAWTGVGTHKKAGHLVSSIPIVAVLTGVRAWRRVTMGCAVAWRVQDSGCEDREHSRLDRYSQQYRHLQKKGYFMAMEARVAKAR